MSDATIKANTNQRSSQTTPNEATMAADQDPLVLHLTRRLTAPRALVFAMCTDSAALAQWWGPNGFTTPSVELDVLPGGRYRIEMQPPDGDRFFLTGEFCAIEPGKRLTFTFRWEDPDPDDQETVVTVTLADVADSTAVTIEQGPFRTEARRELHTQGWIETLDRLEALLAVAASASAQPFQKANPRQGEQS
jgi:uncharacterized protein YndB with AHSA1/START domain